MNRQHLQPNVHTRYIEPCACMGPLARCTASADRRPFIAHALRVVLAVNREGR